MPENDADGAQVDGAAREPRVGFSQAQVGAAVSKLVSASIGDIAVVFSRSPRHKHYTLADIEWLLLPAVLTGQYYIAELQHTVHGARAPLAAVLWARVSSDVAARLSASPQNIRLFPHEWGSGDQFWIVDVVGDERAAAGALARLADTVFRGRMVKIITVDAQGVARVEELHALVSESREAASADD